MAMNCRHCQGSVAGPASRGPPLVCVVCDDVVHRQCVNLDVHAFPMGTWTCPDCLVAQLTIFPSHAVLSLLERVVTLASHDLADGTQAEHQRRLQDFQLFAQQVLNLRDPALIFPPLIPWLHICLFLAHKQGAWSAGTLDNMLSTFRRYHHERGVPATACPTKHPMVVKVVKALKRAPFSKPGSGPKAPLSWELFNVLVQHLHWCSTTAQLPEERLHWLRDACMLAVGYFGLLRRSELVRLELTDLQPALGSMQARVVIRQSKTDQAGVGAWVPLLPPPGPLCTFDLTAMLSEYTQLLRALHPACTALFPGFRRHVCTGQHVPKSAVAKVLKDAVVAVATLHGLQLDAQVVSSHSLRRGFASFLKARGVADIIIMRLGRWRSLAFARYTWLTSQQLAELVSNLR